MTRTMLVGADRALFNETADLLREAGGQVLVVADAGRAEQEISRFRPEMIVVSIDDPGAEGWKLMFRHGLNGGAQVIATTTNGDANQELTVLRLGAQDYVRLPVSPEILAARISFRGGATAKAQTGTAEQILKIDGKRGTLVMDKSRFQVFWMDTEMVMTKTEFDLLFALARHDGLVKSREQLIEAVYDHGQQLGANDRNIDSHIKRIRNKFRKVDPVFDGIETVYALGYKLRLDRSCRAEVDPLPFRRARSAGFASNPRMSRLVTLPCAAAHTSAL